MNDCYKNGPLVSVIVPAYNVERWITLCIDTVITQTYENVEIIIVNDGSSDATRNLIGRLILKDKRVRSFDQANLGPSAARNMGIRLARGDIILFLDADDWIQKDAVLEIVSRFESHRPDIVVFPCLKFFEKSKTLRSPADKFYWSKWRSKKIPRFRAGDNPDILTLYPLAQLKAYTKRFLDRENLAFEEGLHYEDNLFHVDCFLANPYVVAIQKPLYAWRQERPGQITSTPHCKDCLYIVEKILLRVDELQANARAHMLILIIRLIAGVARTIANDAERLGFLAASRSHLTAHEGWGNLTNTLPAILADAGVHPGDKALVLLFVDHTTCLSSLLGRGLTRLSGNFRLLNVLLLGRRGRRLTHQAFTSIAVVSLLRNYAKGVGDGQKHAAL